MAAADEYPNLDEDEFDDYNPHPYSGGYDISATYGAPLPPSPSTCYPISSTSTPAAVPIPAPTAPLLPSPTPAPATPHLPSSPAQPRSISPEPRKPPPPPPPVAEPYYWPEPYDYGDAPRDRPMYATPEVFRGWPYFAGAQCYSRCGRDYWGQCMRGLDYLFGHSDGYGERRIGVDYHGVPVYANRKGGAEDAVVVEVVPPAVGNVEWHYAGEEPDRSNEFLSSYDAESKISAQPIYCYKLTISTLVSNRYMLRLSLWKQFILTTWSTMRTSQHTTTQMISIIWRCQDIHMRYSPMHTYQMIHLNLISLLGL